MIIFAFMGFREILFGKGDIKAAVSIIYSMALLSVYAGHLISIPLPFLFFLNLGIASSLASSWSMYYIWKVTGKFGFAVKFSGKVDEIEDIGATELCSKFPFRSVDHLLHTSEEVPDYST